MTAGATIVNHFDLVNYVLKKYRVMMLTEIAEVFRISVTDMYDVYNELGIDPLEITIQNCKQKEKVFDKEEGIEVIKTVTKQFMHIKPSPRKPNREPETTFKRIKGVYSNTTPFGIAKSLDDVNKEEGKDA